MKIKESGLNKLELYANKEENTLSLKKYIPNKLSMESYKENLLQDFFKVLFSSVN